MRGNLKRIFAILRGIGIGGNRRGKAGPDKAGPDNAGPDNAGPDNAGSDNAARGSRLSGLEPVTVAVNIDRGRP